jgi:hypothetical protein
MSINFPLILQKQNSYASKQKRHNHRIEISINDKNIEQVNQTTVLGVIIDENVNMA